MHIPEIFANGARRYPDRDCLVEGDRRLTFRDAHERARRAAAGFASLGLAPGQRIAILARNELEYLEVLAACSCGGFVAVPLNFRMHPAELATIVADCRPSAIVMGMDFIETASQLGVDHLLGLGPNGAYSSLVAASSAPEEDPDIRSDDLWAIYYTGGTTGRSKGVMLTNGALYGRINEFTFEFNFRPGDRFLQVQPMFHMASQISACFAFAGATTFLMRAFDEPSWFAAVETHRITHALIVPTILNRLCAWEDAGRRDLSSLQQIHYSASPITVDLLQRALRLFPCSFQQSYGQTETGLSTVLTDAEHKAGQGRLLSSAGRPCVSTTIRVVDAEGAPAPPGVVGEVIHRGVGQMSGYWNQEELTRETLQNGFIRTGDLGYLSEDGYLFLVDRKKDMIITGGENVYAREVEDALSTHPGVLEAAVIGIPDPRWGEAVHAVVVLRAGHEPDMATLIAHCRARLAGYKVPKAVSFIDQLPKTPVGKVLKTKLRKQDWKAREE
jgi:long-chain acyl-CoA synthetase